MKKVFPVGVGLALGFAGTVLEFWREPDGAGAF